MSPAPESSPGFLSPPIDRAPSRPGVGVGSSETLRVKTEGLTVLHDGGQNPIADIVFVHGLQGHPRNTWTFVDESSSDPARSRSKSSLRICRLLRKIKGKRTTKSGCLSPLASTSTLALENEGLFWPKELLAVDFCNCRILTYGYDSEVSRFFTGPANQNNVSEHGNGLLKRLEAVRRDKMTAVGQLRVSRRKIIFVVHSLGGLILKETLRRSMYAIKEDQDYRNIYDSTFAIMFFGTPHRGSDYAQIGLVAKRIAIALGFDANDANLRDLKPNSEYTTMLREEFGKLLHEKEVYIDTFQEARGYHGISGLRGKIVENDSSALDYARERKEFINANHVNMCRFKGVEDDGYVKVREALERHIEKLMDEGPGRHVEELADNVEEASLSQVVKITQDCLESLNMTKMNIRRDEIRPHYISEFTCHDKSEIRGTQHWLYDATESGPGLVEWLKTGHGIFWIRGKPGSGKSTAMKNIYNNHRTRELLPLYADTHGNYTSRPWLLISAFFHERGESLQKSLVGVLSILIYQILTASQMADVQADLLKLIIPHGRNSPNSMDIGHGSQQNKETETEFKWTLAALKSAFLSIVSQSRVIFNVCILVDALDEHEEDKLSGTHDEMVNFFKELVNSTSSNVQLKMIVSSRPENVFQDQLVDNEGFYMEKFTREDIDCYIQGRLGTVLGVTSFRPTVSSVSNSATPGPDTKTQRRAEKLLADIAASARGVFLWVALVIDQLLKEWKRSRLISTLEKSFLELPRDLQDLYEYILKRIAPQDRYASFITLELILRARRSISLFELGIMVAVAVEIRGKPANSVTERTMDIISEMLEKLAGGRDSCLQLYQELRRLLQIRCMGLLEISGGDLDFLDRLDPTDIPPQGDGADVERDNDENRNTTVHNLDLSVFEPITSERPGVAQITPEVEDEYYLPSATRNAQYIVVDPSRSEIVLRQDQEALARQKGNHIGILQNRKVQFLHQTAKEYLLDSTILYRVFEAELNRDLDQDNGNIIYLKFCLQYLKLPEELRDAISHATGYDPGHEVMIYAPSTESEETVSSTGLLHRRKTSKSIILDELDCELSSRSQLKDCWPERFGDGQGWSTNFLAFAVTQGMRRYVAESLNEEPGLVNDKPGRPLLHYAVFSVWSDCQPQMALDLIAQGANIHAVFQEKAYLKTALESIMSDRVYYDNEGQPVRRLMDILLEAGADPNSKIYYIAEQSSHDAFWKPRSNIGWRPLIHEIARMRMHCKFKLLEFKRLHRLGVKVHCTDSQGTTLLEVLGSSCKDLSKEMVAWMLRNGAKITRKMKKSPSNYPYFQFPS